MVNSQRTETTPAVDVFADELTPGTKLMHGQYVIEGFLNAGGFGITYAAKDSLDRRVVIKECFPAAFCRRVNLQVLARSRAHQAELASIVRLFVQEARSLAKLNHPNIVGVHQVFEENNTAYMALDYVHGRDLLDVIEDPNVAINPDIVEPVLRRLLNAIGAVHRQNMLHRDISPDNILLDHNNNPVLIDFGAAREQATKQSRILSALRVVKDGYSPQEFYVSGSPQGPYSDLYALAASFYHLMSDVLPPSSQERLAAVAAGQSDPYSPLAGSLEGYRPELLAAIDQALAILPKDRLQSAQQWIALLDGASVAVSPSLAAPRRPVAKPVHRSNRYALLAAASVIAIFAFTAATQLDGFGEPQSDLAASTAADPEIVSKNTIQALTTLPNLPLAAPSIDRSSNVSLTPVVADRLPAQTIDDVTITNRVDFSGTDFFSAKDQNTRIFAVNGTKVASRAEFDAAVSGLVGSVKANLVTLDVWSGQTEATAQTQTWTLPVAKEIALNNGLVFQARRVDQSWQTEVVSVPDAMGLDLQQGDVLFGYLGTNEFLSTATALADILRDETAKGVTIFNFAVQRGRSTWAVGFPMGAADQDLTNLRSEVSR
ncbi:MAG: serine/threonine protein kinase [Paracoccaceae bacterium]